MVDAAETRGEIRFDTVEEYLDWAMTQEGRHELVDGVVYAMSPERVSHALCKGEAWRALADAIRKAGLPCTAIPDGATVRTATNSAYEPDVTVQCTPLDHTGVIADAPIILVEVISESSRNTDTGKKLSGYFTIPTVMHYLILDTDKRLVIHHARHGARIETTFVTDGSLTLDPPGLTVAVADMFAPEE
jgi:Uma2 family endonuclease